MVVKHPGMSHPKFVLFVEKVMKSGFDYDFSQMLTDTQVFLINKSMPAAFSVFATELVVGGASLHQHASFARDCVPLTTYGAAAQRLWEGLILLPSRLGT